MHESRGWSFVRMERFVLQYWRMFCLWTRHMSTQINRLLDYHSKTQINRHRLTYSLLNQTVQQKLISRWDRRTLRGNSKYCLNHSMLWNVTTPIYSFSLKRSLSRRGIATFLVHRDFLIIAGYLVTYFLTDEFLVDKEWSVIFNEETVCGQEMV